MCFIIPENQPLPTSEIKTSTWAYKSEWLVKRKPVRPWNGHRSFECRNRHFLFHAYRTFVTRFRDSAGLFFGSLVPFTAPSVFFRICPLVFFEAPSLAYLNRAGHAKELYSRIAIHQKNQRVSILMHCQRQHHQHFPWYDVFISYKLRFKLWSTKRKAVKIHPSSNHRHER